MRLCTVCNTRPAGASLLRLRGLVHCHRCHYEHNRATRQAKWNTGHRPVCKQCGSAVPETNYVGHGRNICHACVYKRTASPRMGSQNRSARNRAYLGEYKKTHPCVDCGESDWRCLEFDHVRGDKTFNLNDSSTRSLKRIDVEIAKCEIRCANCHRKRHIPCS